MKLYVEPMDATLVEVDADGRVRFEKEGWTTPTLQEQRAIIYAAQNELADLTELLEKFQEGRKPQAKRPQDAILPVCLAALLPFCQPLLLQHQLSADLAARIHRRVHVAIGVAAEDGLHHVVGRADPLIGTQHEGAEGDRAAEPEVVRRRRWRRRS